MGKRAPDINLVMDAIHAEALEKGVALPPRAERRDEHGQLVLEQRRTEITPSKGKRTGPPRPVSERQLLLQLIWNLTLAGRSFADIVEIMEDEHGIAESTTYGYYTKCKARLEAVADQRLVDIWIRQVARLEDTVTEAKAAGKYEAVSMLEGVLMKVAGTGAPEKILHKHEVAVVDKRAEEIHLELQRIRDNTEGPRAIAHQVTDAGLADPNVGTLPTDGSSAITNTAAPITERAQRGRRPGALSSAFSMQKPK